MATRSRSATTGAAVFLVVALAVGATPVIATPVIAAAADPNAEIMQRDFERRANTEVTQEMLDDATFVLAGDDAVFPLIAADASTALSFDITDDMLRDAVFPLADSG